MEFFVREVSVRNEVRRTSELQQNANDKNVDGLSWNWQSVNDFDRMERFKPGVQINNEVVFKLIKSNRQKVDDMEEQNQSLVGGYDCFSIYKHQDNSYEWRLCKLMGKELRPEFKQFQKAVKGIKGDVGQVISEDQFGETYKKSAGESD